MPELPEVETTKVSLEPLLNSKVSQVKVYQPKLRWPIPDNIEDIEGYRLDEVYRRAKYLILTFIIDSKDPLALLKPHLKRSLSLIIHLGMSGSLQQYPLHTQKRKHDHLIIAFEKNDYKGSSSFIQLHYHDPRRFGAVLWHHDYAHKLFNHLGVEPLEQQFTGNYLYNRVHKLEQPSNLHDHKTVGRSSKTKPFTRAIKSIIMDQTFVVGVGNIYATESLFLSKIHPSTPANLLTRLQMDVLTQHIKTILTQSIELGGSTLRDFTVASGTTGYFQQTLNIYGKLNEPCPSCDVQIDKVIINGRTSTFCPACQKI